MVFINWYGTLAKIFILASMCSGIMAVVGLGVFWRFIKKHEGKRVEEVERQLLNILRFVAIAGVLSSVLGITGLILR